MSFFRDARVFAVIFFTHYVFAQNTSFVFPEVTIEPLSPKGLRVSIPDQPNIHLFVFNAHINRIINQSEIGTIFGQVIQKTGGRWVYEDDSIELKPGDVINYYAFVSADSKGYIKDNLTYKVTGLQDKNADPLPLGPSQCSPTVTRIRGGSKACSRQIIFEENFDRLREDVWQIEHYIPSDHPEFPFVSYQRLSQNPTVSVVNGNLRIKPALLQNMPGFSNETVMSGSLNLISGCTGTTDNSCYTQALGANILPPVVSGRIVSKPGFGFTYGTVEIRAKLPKGDWLYPDILLEPFLKKYGNLNYASGVLRIASALGNTEAYVGPSNYGNKVLYGGPIMDLACRTQFLNTKVSPDKLWGDEFHTYSIVWEPDRLTFVVDNVEWARVEAPAGGLHARFPSHCGVPHTLLAAGQSRVTPFDDHFYITLGISAGGVTEFRDGLFTKGGSPKPWRNDGRKAILNFWQNLHAWLPSWETSELLVDYVRVVAL